MNMKALVLAAGKGTRMQSGEAGLPKVMREACGRPLLSYVVKALSFLPREDILLVVGYKKEAVLSAFPGYPYAVQEEQLGTGHAVVSARELLSDYTGSLLICCGDMPLMRTETYEALIRKHAEDRNLCTLLSGVSDEPLPYGRIRRDARGDFSAIIEERDCTPEEKAIRELNAGVYVFEAPALFSALSKLRADNAQGEYYLTDVPGLIREEGGKVGVSAVCTPLEMLGVNTPEQLREVEAALAGA